MKQRLVSFAGIQTFRRFPGFKKCTFIRVFALCSLISLVSLSAHAQGTFAATGSLNYARFGNTSTLLNNGEMLIVGGLGIGTTVLSSAELYDPTTGTFTSTGSLNTGRAYHTATLLASGEVLIAGGEASGGGALYTAELYDPSTGVFTLTTGSMSTARYYHAATLLANGEVLITGPDSSAEIYDPLTNSFSTTGGMSVDHWGHAAILLSTGKVLVAAGYSQYGVTSTAELYDPTAATFSTTGSMNTGRESPAVALLGDGTVLFAGGNSNGGTGYLDTAEIYDPSTATFNYTTGNLNTARQFYQGQASYAASVLSSGEVLIPGGANSGAVSSAELYNPSLQTFSYTGSLDGVRWFHTAALLGNGTVLVLGGDNGYGFMSNAEIYQVGTTRYVSQSGGTFSGGTACNGQSAISVSTFNSTTNSPGDVDILCGTITSAVTPQGSGTSGNWVTIKFDSGANISMGALPTSGALVLTGLSNYIVDGGGGDCGYVTGGGTVSCNGGTANFESTANGSGLANQVNSIAIDADNTTNVEITGLYIGPVYQHTSSSDTATTRTWCVHAYSSPTNLSIHNNTMHDVGWCLDGGGPGLQFYNNEVYYMDHGVGSGGPYSGALVYGNDFHDMANWDTTTDAYHHDGVHFFTDNGALSDVYVYNNFFGGDMGNDATSWIYLEADSNTFNNRNVFNNRAYVASGRNSCCGVIGLYTDGSTSSSGLLANNTVYGPGMTTGTQIYIGAGQSGAIVENNIAAGGSTSTGQNLIGVVTGASVTTLSNDAYFNGAGSNSFSWMGSFTGSFTTWVSDSGETNGVFNSLSSFNLNGDGLPQSGSVLIGAGANLTSLCTGNLGPLCNNSGGNARPTTGAWTIGAW